MAESRTRRHPLDFRKEEVGLIMERWRAAESCSLVGVGSVGKSNLMQHLANAEVQTAYMKETHAANFKAIIIDPSMLGPLPTEGADAEQVRCWAGYELMMHRLFLAFYRSNILDDNDTRRFAKTYEALQNGSNPLYAYMGLRYFELGLEFFMQNGIHIVFMFDEFEVMLKNLPVKFFLTLRGLRDANKKQLSYLTFTRAPLPDVVAQAGVNPLDIEQFIELFNDNTYYIGPYNEDDARRMVNDLIKRNNKRYSDSATTFLLWATGRFAGLLRAGFRVLDSLKSLDSSSVMTRSMELAREMAQKQPIRTECRTIWLSLTKHEQHVLKVAAGVIPFNRSEINQQAIELLAKKSLLRSGDTGEKPAIEPPVFHYFVLEDPEAVIQKT
ncbi:MAG: hypothetical protein K8L99_07020 [Anaerolineae bacterium]|nr:hypothetical protein [Anaerolineae bacterium]